LPVEEPIHAKEVREGRLQEVRNAFLHSWNGYKAQAWGQDELRPIVGGFKTPFCGWAAVRISPLIFARFELYKACF
jgi:mannosyl-oligosaccharide alpha-1,2-mannosidase